MTKRSRATEEPERVLALRPKVARRKALPEPVRRSTFKVPRRPASASRRSPTPQVEDPGTPASLSLLRQHHATHGSGKDRCNEWLRRKAPTLEKITGAEGLPPFAQYLNLSKKTVFEDHASDVVSVAPESTIRPLDGTRGRPETSYFESDIDDPTVQGDRDDASDDEPDDVFVTYQAKSWVYSPRGNPRHCLPIDVKHKAALFTIERHWGGPVAEIIPAAIQPKHITGPEQSSIDPMDWDKAMVQMLKKVAALCCLKEFEQTMGGSVSAKSKALPRPKECWMTLEDMKSLYASLKKRGAKRRTLEDVANHGPNVDWPRGLYRPPVPQWEQ